MSLKQLNTSAGAWPLPKNWTSETRFIDYQYAAPSIPCTTLPQQPGSPVTSSQVLSKIGAKVDGRDSMSKATDMAR
jgi:hypothetical protein